MTGNILQNKYFILETLGQSTFSETLLAKDQSSLSSRRYVIKKFRPILGNPQVQETKFLFQKEANILKQLSGKNSQIPRLYEHFMIGEDFYLVREWINGITLKQKVEQQGEIPETEVKQILISILAVLKYIHSYGIVYRQLKPRNIILRQDKSSQFTPTKHLPVPIYFGGVKELKIESQLNQHSLHEYSSPEHKQGKSIYASDLYSLGLTAIYLLTGKTPSQLTWDSKRNQYLWQPEDFKLQTNLARVINRAICINPQERFKSADEMLTALHSESIVISDSIISPVNQPKEKLYLTPEVKITSILFCLGLGVIGIFYSLLNFDFTQLTANNNQDNIDDLVVYKSSIKTSSPKITSSPPKSNQSTSKLDKSYTKSSNSSTIKPARSLIKPSKIPSFTIGTTHKEVINRLGNPTKQTKGYWGNTTALSYQNMAVNKYDLGYLVDRQTGDIRQTEICFAESVDDLIVIQQTVQKLLSNNYSPEIEQDIEQVFLNKSDEQYFQANNLEGVVQRNSENNLYIGIWDADFH